MSALEVITEEKVEKTGDVSVVFIYGYDGISFPKQVSSKEELINLGFEFARGFQIQVEGREIAHKIIPFGDKRLAVIYEKCGICYALSKELCHIMN